MKRILAIGIGSLIMKDDGIGSRVAEALRTSLQEHDILSFSGETDFAACFHKIRPDDFLILIDATSLGREPGSIEIMPLRETLQNRGRLCAQHDFSLFDVLFLLYPDIEGFFIGIEAVETGFGLELSDELGRRFEPICSAVLAAVIQIKKCVNR